MSGISPNFMPPLAPGLEDLRGVPTGIPEELLQAGLADYAERYARWIETEGRGFWMVCGSASRAACAFLETLVPHRLEYSLCSATVFRLKDEPEVVAAFESAQHLLDRARRMLWRDPAATCVSVEQTLAPFEHCLFPPRPMMIEALRSESREAGLDRFRREYHAPPAMSIARDELFALFHRHAVEGALSLDALAGVSRVYEHTVALAREPEAGRMLLADLSCRQFPGVDPPLVTLMLECVPGASGADLAGICAVAHVSDRQALGYVLRHPSLDVAYPLRFEPLESAIEDVEKSRATVLRLMS